MGSEISSISQEDLLEYEVRACWREREGRLFWCRVLKCISVWQSLESLSSCWRTEDSLHMCRHVQWPVQPCVSVAFDWLVHRDGVPSSAAVERCRQPTQPPLLALVLRLSSCDRFNGHGQADGRCTLNVHSSLSTLSHHTRRPCLWMLQRE